MIIIGERINSSRQKVAEAINQQDATFIQNEARMQAETGADYLDVNAGVFGEDEAKYLEWLIRVVQEASDKPLCIDSSNPSVFAAALKLCQGRAFLNSVMARKEDIDAVIPLLKEYPCNIVAMCLEGPEAEFEGTSRLAIADRIIGMFTGHGIELDRVYLDPVIKPVATDSNAGIIALNTIQQVIEKYPQVHTVCGVSNISFGLPQRKLINGVFAAMAIERGLDALLVDPCDQKLMTDVFAANLLSGKDESCLGYIKAYRGGKLAG
ncbi:MAG: dihydropteroate synthase [Chloroflexota bacterium]